MHKFKRKVTALILLCLLAVTPVYATGMPVVDFSAIATAIANAASTVQQWQREIKKWQDEYNRYVKSIQGIANGEWHTVLRELSNIVDTAKGSSAMEWWGSETAYDVMTGLSGNFTDILNIVSPWELLGTQYDTLNKAMESIVDSLGKGENFNDKNNAALDMAATSLDYVNLLLNAITNSGEAATDLINDWFATFALDKQFYKEVLQGKEDEAYQSLSAYRITNMDMLIKEKELTATEIAKVEKDLMNINRETDTELYNQTEYNKKTLEKKLNTLSTAEYAIRNIEKAKKEIDAMIEEDKKTESVQIANGQAAATAKSVTEMVNNAEYEAAVEAKKKFITAEQILPPLRTIY